MPSVVEEAADSLDRIGNAILSAYSDDRPINEIWGWNLPPVTRQEVAALPAEVAVKLRALNPKSLPESTLALLRMIPSRINSLIGQSIPHLSGSQAGVVVDQIELLCRLISRSLPPSAPQKVNVDWKDASDKQLIPKELLGRLRSIEASLRALEPRTVEVSEQMKAITDAHAAAESLPTDLETLAEARAEIDQIRKSAVADREEISSGLESAQRAVSQLKEDEEEASRVLASLGQAYSATTTQGLAASFSNKAMVLNATLIVWVIGLVGALSVGAYIAASRFKVVEALVNNGEIAVERLWVQLALGIVGIGAPVWFAWIATKQIGQRFRLAEDYGFKASVAKAYEGYRREAARIDPAFEARLFASALTRLEEPPIRLVEHDSYGSPWHEFIVSGPFQRALDMVPELREKYAALVASVGAKSIPPTNG